ncbi:MAG: hypothetical protein WAV41_02800 [Microgenomates group bacterium]
MTNKNEIHPKVIDTTSLKLVKEKRIEAYATTVDGRKVIFRDQVPLITIHDATKLPHTIEHQRYFLRKQDADIIFDENAVVVGESLWRRGRSQESVKILTGNEMDLMVREVTDNLKFTENTRENFFQVIRTCGVWEVVED